MPTGIRVSHVIPARVRVRVRVRVRIRVRIRVRLRVRYRVRVRLGLGPLRELNSHHRGELTLTGHYAYLP
jgi:hypothetical protein